MIDNRLLANPSCQNENIYQLAVLDYRRRPFNRTYDYYIQTVNYDINRISKFHKEELDVGAQMGVLILQDWCREVFENISMRHYVSKCITGYTINKWNIHNAFNDYY